MADLGEGPVGPGLPLIVRPPPPLPLSEGLHPPLRRVLSYKNQPIKNPPLKICMINSSDQKKATVADPELQIRGLGGGGGNAVIHT